MVELIYVFLTIACSLAILYGLTRLSKVTTSVSGNQICWAAMVIAMLATIIKDGSYGEWYIWASVIAGCAAGLYLSNKVKMIEMPQLVAFLNGIGGGSAGIVGFLILFDVAWANSLNWFVLLSSGLAVLTGMLTISGAFVAAGKLARLLPQKPVVLKNHNLYINILLGLMLLATIAITFSGDDSRAFWSVALVVLGLLFGVTFTIRVGGADMPITISLLNSLAGVSGAIAGFAIGDVQLVAIGGIVGSAGMLLTQVMCRAMNKHLFDILLGKTAVGAGGPKKTAAAPAAKAAPAAPKAEAKDFGAILRGAKKVIIVPGYGMALAQAQHKVKQLADALEKKGAEVNYAIHPVAGRMPGHMNVLLAECNVDYEQLLEMDTVNPMFKDTDVVIVVGANDVVNPAAMKAEGTPIYGMPILRADEAKNVIVCNYDTKPGYAGVDNPLYTMDSAIMMLGDASETMDKLMASLSASAASGAAPVATGSGALLNDAKKVIIVPGYGMALAQAQQKVKQLADTLEANGAEVDFAIHPVAGRMPGHMNVLLAEANVEYEKLLEMDTVNPMFKDTDVVIVVGANDVVNPAAMEAEGTPIYGMPILTINDAKHIVICNFDTKPGYAGVDNPLYTSDKVTMMLGDASQTIQQLMDDMATAKAGGGACGCSAGDDLPAILQGAKKVIIVPGYGMALAQAQQKVKQLADTLEGKGAEVDFAIHPVAGRMPGHMNVLLAEANVEYEKLLEMDTVNPMFKDTDVVIVVGANDVVNPAAMEAEGTPIYGMPILTINDAKHIIICNFDTKPGYAGVDNPLYTSDKVTMKLGDASQTVQELIDACSAPLGTAGGAGAAPAAGGVDLPALVQGAKKVIIVPGYGMALAQAQQKVKQLADTLEGKGAEVDFAIHPVAGRMPGHMNVLLAEANVDYEKLLEMDTVNPMFPETDLVIIIGANDVVNPAAMEAEGTPIYGMPILRADAAKNVIVCNFDTKPGYAGVDNPLYEMDKTIMMLGDAGETVQTIIDACSAPVGAGQAAAAATGAAGGSDVASVVANAKKVIIVPGYGMALAQAQQKVKQLADTFEANGAEVDFAIHPVAGRMPGHMNVLLAEANVDYEKLLEMDTVNPMFPNTDLVVVIGANDVVNPAAMEAEGTPIYGMPILRADEAKRVIVCNFDDKPGYAGVDNPLYTMDRTIMMLGDAAETVDQLIKMVK